MRLWIAVANSSANVVQFVYQAVSAVTKRRRARTGGVCGEYSGRLLATVAQARLS